MIAEFYSEISHNPKRILFLDRDGTLIRDDGYFADPTNIEFLDHNLSFFALVHKAGIPTFLVSNQSGIARGIFSMEVALKTNRSIANHISQAGGELTGSVFCPHLPTAACCCRKPMTEMFELVLRLYNFDAKRCLFIGNADTDKFAAKSLMMPFVHANGNGISEILKEWMQCF